MGRRPIEQQYSTPPLFFFEVEEGSKNLDLVKEVMQSQTSDWKRSMKRWWKHTKERKESGKPMDVKYEVGNEGGCRKGGTCAETSCKSLKKTGERAGSGKMWRSAKFDDSHNKEGKELERISTDVSRMERRKLHMTRTDKKK